ncbi:42880_t:CDS:2, partial [Gigaspora margarita]
KEQPNKAVKVTESDDNYKNFHNNFYTKITSKKDPYFAIYDFDYEIPGEGRQNKIIFISWGQIKTISAASKEVLKNRLDIPFQIEGTKANNIKFEKVLDKVLSK